VSNAEFISPAARGIDRASAGKVILINAIVVDGPVERLDRLLNN